MITAPWHKLSLPKELVCEFLAVFSRFEFALKATTYARQNNRGYAEPNWSAFGHAISTTFDAYASPELDAAVTYLIANPPNRQSYSTINQQLTWEPLPPATASQAEQVISYVRCVRNNLFHGGKFLVAPPSAPDRDFQLVSSSLVVLDALLHLDNNLENAFFH